MGLKIGIITFHNSYNCGSMLESFAMQEVVKKYGKPEIVDYSSIGQKNLYAPFRKNNSLRNMLLNLSILPARKRILLNCKQYEEFKERCFNLSKEVDEESIRDLRYDIVVAGSDQIWNTTIQDFNEVYFLNWAEDVKKVAYSPSFGSKNPIKYYRNIDDLKKYLSAFSALSIREKNGSKWLSELGFKSVPVLLDPTLLLDKEDYEKIEDSYYTPRAKYIFFYSPSFNTKMCKFVKMVAKKYNFHVITWSTKSYYRRFIKRFGFTLPPYESPAVYLNLIKNAELVFTTSYHGTIFSTIYNKKFFCLKNGGMYGDDDRVITLLEQLDMMDRLIKYDYDASYNYLSDVDYTRYKKILSSLRRKSFCYLDNVFIGVKDEKRK